MTIELRRRGILIGVVVVAVVAVALFLVWRSSPEIRIDLDRDDIQSRVAAKLPLRNCALGLACLEMKTATVVLNGGSDRIGIRSELVATLGNREMPGVASISGKPRYVPAEGRVYIDDLRIDELQIDGMSRELTQLVRLGGPSLLRGVLQSTPIYTLRGASLRESFARFALQKVEVIDGKLRLTLRRPSD